ncbi:MAG: Uma2 family endonuclease [Actinobacteria bacterium]|nr:Uma2 family endonuclease [Actinomycetota bacterium]MBO0834721.1 Uma2 family endonuclease [Actinomycetota bacterium]
MPSASPAQLLQLLGPLAQRAGLLTSGPFNLGDPRDFRVPDAGLHRGQPDPDAVYLDTAAMVVEIASPGDETYDKLPFYAAHGVQEVLIVDPVSRSMAIKALAGTGYEDAKRSSLLDLELTRFGEAIRWP